MNYYLDTEFIEGTQKSWFGQTKPTIDLISIGLVSEDGREFYAISKDFNLKEAWNRFQLEQQSGDMRNTYPEGKKVYWLRENVLKPIHYELATKETGYTHIDYNAWSLLIGVYSDRNYNTLKKLINKYGKTNKQIAEEVKEFVQNYKFDDRWELGDRFDSAFGNGVNNSYFYLKDGVKSKVMVGSSKSSDSPKFHAYYADYDWVAFCWLFGKMIDLPKGFPMYCRDLKQEMDTWINTKGALEVKAKGFEYALDRIKNHKDYPKQTNSHNALADAKFNKELHSFLQKLGK